MNLVTFSARGTTPRGVTVPRGVLALSAEFAQWRSLRDVIAAQAIPQVPAAAKGQALSRGDGAYVHEIPLPDPDKTLCVGVNFPDRNTECRDGQVAPPNVSLFIRFARSFTGHGQPLLRPPESEQRDDEGEIAVVIGSGGRRILEAEALGHIAAPILCNEGTIRDRVRHAKFNVTQGKNREKSGAMGPSLVPFTDPAQILDVALETGVNGELRQSDRTGRMLLPGARQIADVSPFCSLVPGDNIVTGTPSGAGARFDPPIWLRPRDAVEVTAEGIGTHRKGGADE